MSSVTSSTDIDTSLSEALYLHGILETNTIDIIGDQFQDYLTSFASHDNFFDNLTLIFGEAIDTSTAASFRQQWLTGATEAQPSFSIVSSATINGAAGAFSQQTNTIYLSQEFLVNQTNNPAAILTLLLEEYGHFIDSQLNVTDTPGDEGAIFANVIQGIQISPAEQQALRQEDDSVVVKLDGEQLTLEQATFGINTAFDLIGLTQLRNDPTFAGIDGSGFSVAVIDTGLDGDHPWLVNNFRGFVDFTAGSSLVTDPSSTYDTDTQNGHGTHVAGTVASSNENIGVAPDAGLIGLQVFGGAGSTTINDALRWVLTNHQAHNITAVNMSLSHTNSFTKERFFLSEDDAIEAQDDIDRRALIDQLEDVGVTVVSAAGNGYGKFTSKPGFVDPAIFSTLAVGAVEHGAIGADRIATFSQRLAAPNAIFAPGVNILSTTPNATLTSLQGTSMASPHVAGSVALLQEVAQQFGGRTLSTAEVANFMRATATTIYDGDDESTAVTSTNTFYPRLNVHSAAVTVRDFFASRLSLQRWGTGQGGFWDAQKWVVGDFDGSGTDDLAKVFNDNGLASIDVHASNGSNFAIQRWGTGQGGFWDTQQWVVGDFNGDGKDDLAKAFNDNGLASIDVHASNGSGFGIQRWGTGQGGFGDSQKWVAGDFDGDGKDDVAKVFNDNGLASIDVHVSNGSSFAIQRWGTGQGAFWDEQKWMVGDFNGDGKDDLAKVFNDNGLASVDVHVSNGSDFAIQRWATGQGGFGDLQKWVVGDFNGDGRDDLAKAFNDRGFASIDAHISGGSGFSIERWATFQGGFWDAQKWLAGDFSGNGTDAMSKVFNDNGLASMDVHALA